MMMKPAAIALSLSTLTACGATNAHYNDGTRSCTDLTGISAQYLSHSSVNVRCGSQRQALPPGAYPRGQAPN